MKFNLQPTGLLVGLCLLANLTFSQSLPRVENAEGQDLSRFAKLELQPSKDTLSFKDYNLDYDTDSVVLSVPGYISARMANYDFWDVETIVLQREDQLIEEVVAAYKLLQRESHETEHVVDFYFLNGQLYQLKKDTRKLKVKLMCIDDSCFEVPIQTKLTYTQWKRDPLVEIDNQIQILRQNGFEDFGSINQLNDLKQIIGEDEKNYYLRYSYFYGLINEYAVKPKEGGERMPIALIYDSSSFDFLAKHHYNPARGVELYYSHKHPNGGGLARQGEVNFKYPGFADIEDMRNLHGNEAFLEMVDILEKASSEGIVLEKGLMIANFTQEYLLINDGENWDVVPIELNGLDYQGSYRLDPERNKAYFAMKKGLNNRVMEIDLSDFTTRVIDPKFRAGAVKQWGVRGGRMYYLVMDPLNGWQRILYSNDLSRLYVQED